MFCWQNDSNVSLFWWNDNNSLLSKLFQWFSYWNHSARVSLFWFCLANVNVDFFSRLVSKSPYIFVYIITFWNYTTKSNKKIIYFHKSVRHQVPPVLKSTFKFRILTPNHCIHMIPKQRNIWIVLPTKRWNYRTCFGPT